MTRSTPTIDRNTTVVRRLAFASLAALLLVLSSQSANAGELTVEILDVGQGDSVLIRTAEKTVLIDAGKKKNDTLDALRARSITRLDMAVATHPHADHIGGMQNVIENVEIGVYVDSGQVHTSGTYDRLMTAVEAAGLRYRTAETGQVYKLGKEAKITVLYPGPKLITGTRSDLNSNSVVMRLDHGNNCFLFTGDAEEPTERALVAESIAECNVLKVAHHGGNHSSSTAFLEAVKPELALISCGEGNSYGHPGHETMDRLQAIGAKVYRTDTQGVIKLTSNGKKLDVVTGSSAAPAAKSGGEVVASGHTPPSASASGGLDVNTATADQLTALKGIGKSKAQKIIDYRDANGPFATLDDMVNVPGVGQKTVDNFRDQAQVGPADMAAAGEPADGINVNLASESELMALPGIGAAKAKSIVAERGTNGPFASCNDLVRVRGIGEKTVAKFAHMCRTQ